MKKWDMDQVDDLENIICIVTGANSGLGYETAKALLLKGATVIMASRSRRRAELALERIKLSREEVDAHILELDLSDLSSVKTFTDEIAKLYDHIDILINNAGIMAIPKDETKDGFERQLGVNHLGHFALTGLLLPLLKNSQSARVVNLSSMAHKQGKMDFEDLNFMQRNYKPFKAYAQSKLANLLFTFRLDDLFKKHNLNIISVAAHPGMSRTNLFSHSKLFHKFMSAKALSNLISQDAEIGALPTLRAALDPQVQGKDYYGPGGLFEIKGYPKLTKAKKAAYDKADQTKLWIESTYLTKIEYQF